MNGDTLVAHHALLGRGPSLMLIPRQGSLDQLGATEHERAEDLLQTRGLRPLGLLHYIEVGDIGLPDIQRPFVWSNCQGARPVRLDVPGLPGRLLLFWENAPGRRRKADRA